MPRIGSRAALNCWHKYARFRPEITKRAEIRRDLAAVAGVNVLQEPESDHVGKHARAAIGKKWQGNAGHRHHPEGHSDIFKSLESKPSNNTRAN